MFQQSSQDLLPQQAPPSLIPKQAITILAGSSCSWDSWQLSCTLLEISFLVSNISLTLFDATQLFPHLLRSIRDLADLYHIPLQLSLLHDEEYSPTKKAMWNLEREKVMALEELPGTTEEHSCLSLKKSMKSIEPFVKWYNTFRGLALFAKNFMSKCRPEGTLMEGSWSSGCMSLYPLLGYYFLTWSFPISTLQNQKTL